MSAGVIRPTKSFLRPDKDWGRFVIGRKGIGGGIAPGAPTSYWKLDSWTTTTPDSIGGRPLTVTGTPTSITGIIGNAANCVIPGNYFTSTDAFFKFGDTNFSWRFWYRQSTLTNIGLIQCKDGSSPFHGWKFQSAITGGAGIFCQNSGASQSVASGINPVANVWNMIVGFHDATNDLIGISMNNSTFVTAAFAGGTGSPISGLFTVTTDTSDMDEIGVWTGKVFTQAEVAYEWNGGAGRTY